MAKVTVNYHAVERRSHWLINNIWNVVPLKPFFATFGELGRGYEREGRGRFKPHDPSPKSRGGTC
jgi:hypothetical protein